MTATDAPPHDQTQEGAAPSIPARSWAIIDSTLREGEQFAQRQLQN